ncbi:acetylneuraminic acid synthetase [Candidatus Thorarchaeota archaeon]|nr:MAG: acetylneuraminic acid synthetase [Candidatus Thorarchaeota archaeon]
MRIANKEIGLNFNPYIIAEIGVNYDNDLDYAEVLIKAAKRTGVDAVKFQTYTPSKIVAISSPKYWDDDKPDETQYEFFERSNRFYHEETKELARLCKMNDISFMSTPFDLDSVKLLDDLGVPAFKIASADITNFPLLRKVAKTGKPVILSTGASSIGEIEEAAKKIEEEGNKNIILLHCILAYPTPADHSNLLMIKCLRDIFPKYEIGWSDHVVPDESVTIPTIATVLGASVIEKHFTTDRTRPGNDHFHSVDEELMTRLVKNVQLAKVSMGEYLKQSMPVEESARLNARRSIAAYKPIKEGEKFSETNLVMLRPGFGIHPKFLEHIIGRKAKRDIKPGHLLEWEDIF